MDRGLHSRAAHPDFAVCVYNDRFGRGDGAYRGEYSARVFASLHDGVLAQRMDGAAGHGSMPAFRVSGSVYPFAYESEYCRDRVRPVHPAHVDELFAAHLRMARASR